jgi:hypothetical protein
LRSRECSCRRPNDGRSHLRDQRSRSGDIETPALVVNGCRRDAGFDQVDPAAVHYLVVPRRRHHNGPAEMIRNAQTHVANYPLVHTTWFNAPSASRPRDDTPAGSRRFGRSDEAVRMLAPDEERASPPELDPRLLFLRCERVFAGCPDSRSRGREQLPRRPGEPRSDRRGCRGALASARRRERRESFVVLALDEHRAQRVRLLLTVAFVGQRSEPSWAHAAAKGW